MQGDTKKPMDYKQFMQFVADTFIEQCEFQLPDIYKAYMIGTGVQHKTMSLKIRIILHFEEDEK